MTKGNRAIDKAGGIRSRKARMITILNASVAATAKGVTPSHL